MDVFYVNLDSAVDRRKQIEANFAEVKKDGWTLHRFAALGPDDVKANNIGGPLSAPRKASSLSQMKIIKENKNATKPFLIVEDDTRFGQQSCSLIEQFIQVADQKEWDLMYLDLTIPDPEQMLKLARLRIQQQETNAMNLLNLEDINYAGAIAYVVNPKILKSLNAYFDTITVLNKPLDLIYRNFVRKKKLKAFAPFPFLTCSSDLSMRSSLQDNVDSTGMPTNDTIWYLFRKLIWNERDLNAVSEQINQVNEKLNTSESRLYGQLISACLSASLPPK